jgi:hypothetical protein
MSAREDGNDHRHTGVLNGQGVGIALAAIFVGVALLVAYAASDGALFAQPSSPAETGQKQDATTPAPVTSSEATVFSRDAFDKEQTNIAAKPPSQPQQETANAASNTEQELLAIKNFPWSSVSGEYVKDSQERFDNLKQLSGQNQSSAPVSSDRILANVDHKEKVTATDDQSVFDQMEMPPISDEANEEPPHDQQNDGEHQNDADNGGGSSDNSSNEEDPPEGSNDNSDSGSTGNDQPSESGNEVPPSNSTDSSSSNSTQSSSAPESENKTSSSGMEIEVSLG